MTDEEKQIDDLAEGFGAMIEEALETGVRQATLMQQIGLLKKPEAFFEALGRRLARVATLVLLTPAVREQAVLHLFGQWQVIGLTGADSSADLKGALLKGLRG